MDLLWSWLSKFTFCAHSPSLEDELVEHSAPEVERHCCINISANDTAPILIDDGNAQMVEEESSQQQATDVHFSEMYSSQTTAGTMDIDQRYGASRNDSRLNPPSTVANDDEDGEIKSGRKFAYWSGSISFTGTMGVIGARAGNFSFRKLPFYSCSTSMALAFLISLLLMIFTTVHPVPINSVTVIKFTQFLILGLFALGVGFGLASVF